jgi:exopolysaccharide biosynthesis polyprenyl glycosylphosphotransferase
MRRNTIKTLLAIGDYAVMVAALCGMILIRYGKDAFSIEFQNHIQPFLIIFLAWVVTFYILELYDINAPFSHRKFAIAMFTNIAVAITLIYLFLDVVGITPRRNLILITVLFVPVFYIWRFATSRLMDNFVFTKAVAFIGFDQYALELIEIICRKKRQGFRVVAIVCDPDQQLPETIRRSSIATFESVALLEQSLVDLKIDTVVISNSWYSSVYQELYRLLPLRLHFYQLTSFWERFDESIPIYSTHESWFLENFNRGLNKTYAIIKRIVDIVTIMVFLPIILLFSVITAILVKISSPGPVLFRQTRVGRNEHPFTIYKFRSMVTDAEKDGAQWASEKDPRITKVGSFIRATRLDELPQLFNVLRGDMSIVGPRPERPEFITELSQKIPHYHLRHLVRPGLTGWAQVRYRYGSSFEDAAIKLTFDLYYVKNISMILDIKIALKTILTVLSRQGR